MSQAWDADKIRVQIARDLRAIVEMYADLEHEAADRGEPTSEAVMLLGPVANVEAWQHRYEAIEASGGDTRYASEQVGELHPLLVLATWEDVVRDERDQPTDLKATVERAADYLRDSVDWMLSEDENGDLNFLGIDAMADELRKVRRVLEDVLRAGDRADRGVPCVNCNVDLVKIWGDTEEADRWRCIPCDQWSTNEQYMIAVRADYLASADRLTASDMEAQYDIKPGTLRKWASEGKVRRRGKDDSGRQLYDVAQATAQIEDIPA